MKFVLLAVLFAGVAGTDPWKEVLGLHDDSVMPDIIETVEEIDELVLDDGAKLKRFRHFIDDFPVWNDEAATVERNGEKRVVSPKKMNRRAKRKVAKDKKKHPEQQKTKRSQKKCIKHWNLENLRLDFSSSERFIYDPDPDYDDGSDAVYADLVHFGGETGDTYIAKFCLVSTDKNAVISAWDGIYKSSSWDFVFEKNPIDPERLDSKKKSKTNRVTYVENLGDGNCRLHNVERNISVFDGQHRSSGYHPESPFTFPCAVEKDGPFRIITELFRNAILAYYMFTHRSWGGLDRVSRDGTVKLKAHYGLNYTHANFDGTYLNFGDGGSEETTCLAVVTHEMAHSVTHTYSRLNYQKGSESGCLNEGFSFIVSPMVQMFSDGTIKKNMLCLGQNCKNYTGCSQDLFEGSQNYSDYFPTCKENAQGGDYCQLPHNCAYLVTSIYGKLKHAWDAQKAGRAFVMANRFTWNRETTIKEAGCGVLAMAIENNIAGGDTVSVVNAWASVGIDISDCDVLKNVKTQE